MDLDDRTMRYECLDAFVRLTGRTDVGKTFKLYSVGGGPNALKIECVVNGQVRQNSNTNDMVFNCALVISYTSELMTLEPGDIIYTGTPEGVIFGKPPEQQVWLKPGDKVVSQIQKTGRLAFDLGVRSAGLAGSGG